jgi:Family of unknown function (DUF5946)
MEVDVVNEKSEQDAFYDLCYYTTTHPDPDFIHQYVVDAFAAQMADKKTKPITITFALVGLYLHLEKNFTGKEVQKAHMQLAKHKKLWPDFKLPYERGNITVYDVIDVEEGSNRDEMIVKWCESVWAAYKENHIQVTHMVKRELWPRKQ